MGIVAVREIAEGRQGEHSLEHFECRDMRYFEVETDSNYSGSLEVRLADLGPSGRIPQVGEYYGQYYTVNGYYHKGLIVQRVRATQSNARETPKIWRVEVEYQTVTSNPNRNDGGGGSPSANSIVNANPLQRPPVAVWGSKIIQIPILKDLNGKAIVNSAGDRYDVQHMEIGLRTLKVTRNVKKTQFSPSYAIRFAKSLNSNTFQNYPPLSVLCDSYDGSEQYENGLNFVTETLDFTFAPYDEKKKQIDENFFKLNLEDKGPNYWDVDPRLFPPGYQEDNPNVQKAKKIPYHAKTGRPNEVYLNGDGTLIKFPNTSDVAFNIKEGLLWPGGPWPGVGGQNRPTPEIIINQFEVRKTMNFSDLQLPDPIAG